jgi:hypothetical protein
MPAAYCLLPTAYCLLPTAYCLLPAACCLLPAAFCRLPTAFCLLPTAFYFATLSPSTGYPAVFQAAKPPNSAAALSIPLVLSSSTAPALVCSLGQVQ